jgi:hypothetical protein
MMESGNKSSFLRMTVADSILAQIAMMRSPTETFIVFSSRLDTFDPTKSKNSFIAAYRALSSSGACRATTSTTTIDETFVVGKRSSGRVGDNQFTQTHGDKRVDWT